MCVGIFGMLGCILGEYRGCRIEMGPGMCGYQGNSIVGEDDGEKGNEKETGLSARHDGMD